MPIIYVERIFVLVLNSELEYMNKICLTFALILMLLPKVVNAENLYAYKSSKGVITFTSLKPQGKSFWSYKPSRSIKVRRGKWT